MRRISVEIECSCLWAVVERSFSMTINNALLYLYCNKLCICNTDVASFDCQGQYFYKVVSRKQISHSDNFTTFRNLN